MQAKGLAPDVIAYSAAFSACEEGQQPHTAMNLFTSMQPKDLTPDLVTHREASSACTK